MKVFDIHFSIQIWHFTKRQGQLSWVQKSGKSFLEELFRLPRWNILTSLFRLQIRIWHFGDLLKVFKASWLLLLLAFTMRFCNFQLCSRFPFWGFHPRVLFLYILFFTWLFHHVLKNSKFIQNRWWIQKDNFRNRKA